MHPMNPPLLRRVLWSIAFHGTILVGLLCFSIVGAVILSQVIDRVLIRACG